MKIHVLYDIKHYPWGGGNQFLKTLVKFLRKMEKYADTVSQADVILVNSKDKLDIALKLNKPILHMDDLFKPIRDGEYIVCTFHRPSNVDTEKGLNEVFDMLRLVDQHAVILPLHPRTLKNISKFGLQDKLANLKHVEVCDPLSYVDFMSLVKYSYGVITDSGGIQEETTFLGVPCITFRKNTERPCTLYPSGTNILVNDIPYLGFEIHFSNKQKKHIPMWDGHAAKRITDVLIQIYDYKNW